MPRHPTQRTGLVPRLRRLVRALGLGSVPASVENAGKRVRRARAALQRLGAPGADGSDPAPCR